MTNYQNFDATIGELLSDFNPKHQKIIKERFGINGEQKTLQAIGSDLGITRERVRQIESQTVKKLRPAVQDKFGALFEKTHNFLESLGGVRHDKFFVRDVRHMASVKDSENLDEKIRFIFIIGDAFGLHKENDHVESFWFAAEESKKSLFDFLKKAENFFKKIEKEEILKNQAHLKEFNDIVHYNYLSVSKRFKINNFGDFGLKAWPEINPKVIRDKAYLVLKKAGTPLHFRDIARLISEIDASKESAHVQTVHNELIKSDKFVLVGRGIYGLKDHGYEGGTVREVIENIFKEYGPLHSKEILRLVNERKILKENTILLNLQNRNYFSRLSDGRYYLKK